MTFMRAPSNISVDDLVVCDAPQVRRADISLFVADLDAAPAVALALADAADDALLRHIAHLRPVVRVGADRPRVAWLNDRRAPVAEQADEHPALRSVGVLN